MIYIFFNPLSFGLCNCPLNIRESFGSSPGLQLPRWKLLWEYEGSFPHTFFIPKLFLLAHNLASPYFGCEPKVRVATIFMFNFLHLFMASCALCDGHQSMKNCVNYVFKVLGMLGSACQMIFF